MVKKTFILAIISTCTLQRFFLYFDACYHTLSTSLLIGRMYNENNKNTHRDVGVSKLESH